jgi:hypothetical protein
MNNYHDQKVSKQCPCCHQMFMGHPAKLYCSPACRTRARDSRQRASAPTPEFLVTLPITPSIELEQHYFNLYLKDALGLRLSPTRVFLPLEGYESRGFEAGIDYSLDPKGYATISPSPVIIDWHNAQPQRPLAELVELYKKFIAENRSGGLFPKAAPDFIGPVPGPKIIPIITRPNALDVLNKHLK